MSELKRITTLDELLVFLPKLKQLYEKGLDNYWVDDSWEVLCEKLLTTFFGGSFVFGDIGEDGEILYFMSVAGETSTKAFFWLMYVAVSYRAYTTSLIYQIKNFLRNLGFKVIELRTFRTTSSYDRWVTKHGAELQSKIYQIKL